MVLLASAAVNEDRRPSMVRIFPVYWHLLSLDAPTVAVLWAWSFARAIAAPASGIALAVLGLGTWLLYIADRLLDARPGSMRGELHERHDFHARHRRAFLVTGTLALVPLGWLIAIMPAAVRLEDAYLFAAAMVYFGAVHLPLPHFHLSSVRNLVVAVIFAFASAVPAWSASTAAHSDLVWMVGLFAALCWLNCAAIHVWENAGPSRRWSLISTLALLVAAAAAMLMIAALRDHNVFVLLAGGLGSALLLFALDRDFSRGRRGPSGHGELSPLALRILADAALLTPLLLVIPWRR